MEIAQDQIIAVPITLDKISDQVVVGWFIFVLVEKHSRVQGSHMQFITLGNSERITIVTIQTGVGVCAVPPVSASSDGQAERFPFAHIGSCYNDLSLYRIEVQPGK